MAGKADIFELMLADHRRINRLQAALRDTAAPARLPAPRLASVWDRLAGLVADHALVTQQVLAGHLRPWVTGSGPACLNASPSKRGYEHPVGSTRPQQWVSRLAPG